MKAIKKLKINSFNRRHYFDFSTIFSKIIKKEIKADILYENDTVRK